MQTNLSLVPTCKQFKSTQAESIGRSPAEKAITLQKQLYYSTVTAGRQDAEGHPHFCDYPVEFSPMHLACEMTRFSPDMFLQSKRFLGFYCNYKAILYETCPSGLLCSIGKCRSVHQETGLKGSVCSPFQ